MYWKASSIEWAVVQSFSSVEPGISVWWKQFDGWTMGELQVACYETDDTDITSRRLFDEAGARLKLSAYVAAFTGARAALEETSIYLPGVGETRNLTVEDVVKEWSEGMDPVGYVVLMKARIEGMMHTIVRLKNTNNIFRKDLGDAKKEIGALKNRLRFLSVKSKK